MADFILEAPVTSLLFTNFFCATNIILFAMTFILPVLIILNCSSCVSSSDDGKISPFDDDGRNGKGSKGKSGNFLSEYEEEEEEEKYIEGDENKKSVITELSSIPVTFSDDSKMIVEENKIVHNREEEYETCLIGEEMKKVYY